jgi:GNAT superfamily N-acetyltransferase
MSELIFDLMDTPDPRARSVIASCLDDYNAKATGVANNTALDVLIRGPASREVLGGLVGRTSLGVFFVDYFFVPDTLRRHGIGRRVLAIAEAEARRRGCATAVLFTMTVQAPGFYERCGYEAFGRVDCDPPGNARVFMTKPLG